MGPSSGRTHKSTTSGAGSANPAMNFVNEAVSEYANGKGIFTVLDDLKSKLRNLSVGTVLRIGDKTYTSLGREDRSDFIDPSEGGPGQDRWTDYPWLENNRWVTSESQMIDKLHRRIYAHVKKGETLNISAK